VFLGRGLCGDHYLLHKELRRYRPSIGVWCSSRAVTSNRNQVSSDRLAKTLHQMFCGRPPRPRSAFVCPLDNGGLIRVSCAHTVLATCQDSIALLLPRICFALAGDHHGNPQRTQPRSIQEDSSNVLRPPRLYTARTQVQCGQLCESSRARIAQDH